MRLEPDAVKLPGHDSKSIRAEHSNHRHRPAVTEHWQNTDRPEALVRHHGALRGRKQRYRRTVNGEFLRSCRLDFIGIGNVHNLIDRADCRVEVEFGSAEVSCLQARTWPETRL